MNKKNCLMVLIIILNLVIFNNAFAQDTCANGDAPPCDEQATFKSVDPDALILLDLSGSMARQTPPHGDEDMWFTWGASTACTPDDSTGHCTGHGDNCKNGYCDTQYIGCNVKCSKLDIAKRALFNILDDNNVDGINISDSSSLGIRFGYMRFKDADSGANYSSGSIRLVKSFGDYYQSIFCGAAKTGSCTPTSTCGTDDACIARAVGVGGTPLAYALVEAKKYLDDTKTGNAAKKITADPAAGCRKKFVILITDGADTYACGGDGHVCADETYGARRESVAKVKALADAGYAVFVVGFGDNMPIHLKYTLNWMAFYGGTDNSLDVNDGNTTHYNPDNTTACQAETNFTAYNCGGDDYNHFFAATNDPGNTDLLGYAFLASNADQLTQALRTAITTISASTYSFTQASIQASRTIDESFLYEAAFSNRTYDPFWIGHLKRYKIGDLGVIAASADWDSGTVLQSTGAGDRKIYTYKNGNIISFTAGTTTSTVTAADLGVATDARRNEIVNFIRGGELDSNDAYYGWKLGDVFHASPMSIASPNALFYDQWDKSTTKAFDTYRTSHQRISADHTRLILIGANDGQLHAFRAGEEEGTTGGGSELWSFIPPNLLPKLTNIAHATHPTLLSHQYFVDGPISAAEIWLDTSGGNLTDLVEKTSAQWHTYLVLAEGRGGKGYLWSLSTSCDSGLAASYSSTYSNYCGYYAFDISDTTAALVYKWRIGGASGLTEVRGKHLGEPWGKMFIGRVRENNTEKWVGLIGGGYSNTNCKGGGSCDTRGKGFYVINLSDGSILWSVTHSGKASDGSVDVTGDLINANMDYDLAASPVAIDTDNDGFLDTAYVPDLGGNVWRFKFCTSSGGTSCTKSDWTASLLFDSSSGVITPAYNPVSVATDTAGKLWVYFGSGDKTDPTASNAQENFYAIKDDLTTTYELHDLESLGSETGTDSYVAGTDKAAGWYINFTGNGEKILSEPLVFEGKVLFTTYIPGSTSNPCNTSGTSKVYGLNYMTGAGIFTGNAKGQSLGSGMATGVSASRGPDGGTNFYTSMSVGTLHTKDIPNVPTSNSANNALIYWHDQRIQP